MANHDEQYFLDIDLSVLGAEQDEYDQYSKQIRQEYEWVPENIYRENRKALLEKILNRNMIFNKLTHNEARARRNLTREIELLNTEV